jgi:S1-C subfamily serine protease
MKHSQKILAIAGLLTLVLGLVWSSLPALALEKEALQRGLRASVKLIILDAGNDPFGRCSGTVLNSEGFLLTNFHCVGQTDIYGPDPDLDHGQLYHPQGLLGVAISENPRQLPVPTYIAQYLTGNPDQDVAVIKIIADLDGNPVEPPLPLVPTALADSDLVGIGDEVSVIGYPSAGGETVTFTEGKIAGFQDEDTDGLTDWFKTDALINGGNSGGTAVNETGEMIGIPSASFFDTARGDSLHFIKPLNQAIPLIQRALQAGNSDVEVGGNEGSTGGSTFASGQNLGEFTFGTGFDDQGVTGQAVSFRSGVAEIHAGVPYQEMRNGTSWGYVWQYEGQDALAESNLRWDRGDSGILDLFIFSDEPEGLPDGEFNLQVLLNGKVVQEGGFVIGTANPTQNDQPQKPPVQESEGVFVVGRIVDFDTGRPIEEAIIVFLQPGLTAADFDAARDTNQVVLSSGITNEDGEYIGLLPLPRNQAYTVLIGKQGYQRLDFDHGLDVLPDDPDIVELEDIALERR